MLKLKLLGNEQFKNSEFKEAIVSYTNAIELREDGVDDEDYFKCLNNRSACYLKLGDHLNALDDVMKVLANNSKDLKALYRRIDALCGLKRYKEAWGLSNELIKFEPGNQTFLKQYGCISKELQDGFVLSSNFKLLKEKTMNNAKTGKMYYLKSQRQLIIDSCLPRTTIDPFDFKPSRYLFKYNLDNDEMIKIESAVLDLNDQESIECVAINNIANEIFILTSEQFIRYDENFQVKGRYPHKLKICCDPHCTHSHVFKLLCDELDSNMIYIYSEGWSCPVKLSTCYLTDALMTTSQFKEFLYPRFGFYKNNKVFLTSHYSFTEGQIDLEGNRTTKKNNGQLYITIMERKSLKFKKTIKSNEWIGVSDLFVDDYDFIYTTVKKSEKKDLTYLLILNLNGDFVRQFEIYHDSTNNILRHIVVIDDDLYLKKGNGKTAALKVYNLKAY